MNLDKTIRNVGLENCYISEITVAELRFGAQNSDNPVKSHKAVNTFLKDLTVKDFERIEGTQIENWFKSIK